MLILLVIFDLLTSSNADTFFLVVPDGSVSGQLGSSVVLPCTLSPSQDCREFEIQWYRGKDTDNPVLLYKDLKVQENDGDPQYRGRAFLVGDLKKGNISLKLENFTLADRGEYVCFVQSGTWYDRASVNLGITVVGSPVLQSLAGVGDQVNITCESDGWSPKPTLTWRDRSGKELWNSSNYYTEDSEGLVSVRSWLMFSPSDSEWISCSVGLSDQEVKEGRVLILNSVSKTLQSGVSAGWKAAFLVLLVIFVVVISLLIFLLIKGDVCRKPSKPPQTDEEAAPLVGKINPPPCAVCTEREINRADGETQTSGEFRPPPCAVCTERELNRADGETQTSGPETADKEVNTVKEKGPETADKETCTDGETQAHPAPDNKDTNTGEQMENNATKFELTEAIKSEPVDKNTRTGEKTTADSMKDNTERTREKERADWNMMWKCKVAIKPESETDLGTLFKERIRAGQYYWEVIGLTEPSLPTLRTNQQNKCLASWYVGVISETVLKNQLQLSPQNCWVLHYDKEKGFYVNDPSLTPVPVKDRFSKLGVFIDCEKNTLSFYNCDKRSHLYTFYNVDCTQPLVPVVFPGLRPQYSLEISTFNCLKCDELYRHYGTRNKQSWS